jgi:Tfp pilus assembly protein PilO
MKGNDRLILLVVPVIAAVAVFWFMVLSPKQDKASKLDQQVTELQSAVREAQTAANDGLDARKQFPRDYHRLVVMGKAVPVDDETASMLVQLNTFADASGINFRAIKLSGGGTATPAPAPATPAPTTSDTSTTASETESSSDSSTSSSGSTATTPAATPAAPTESAAASLPIGATVGSAGLPTLPYELTFRGTYFQIANFMAAVDGLVNTHKATVAADGRLVTIDGFTLSADDTFPYPVLQATLNITTYVTPAGQGLTAGATPSSPAPVPTTPASAPVTP